MSSGDGRPDVADISSSAPVSHQTAVPAAFAFAKLLERQYLLVLLSALAIIWLGAHGSLRRPPSAAPAKPKKGEKRPKEQKFVEGLVASDAIMFPLLLGVVLVGLYYLIQWLQDPAILNKLLRGYVSIMSIAGLGTLVGDALDVLTSLVFPSMWADRSGRVCHIEPERRCQYFINRETGDEVVISGKETPLPGFLSNIALSPRSNRLLWELRRLLNEDWTAQLNVHGTCIVKLNLRINDVLRFAIAGAIAIAYHLTRWDAFSNLLSFAMCYVSFAMFSPTSFGIGTMVLASLFVYDIVMVFYTPYMITVAKNLDVPIKLVFKGPKGASMLGLGDIVVPGMLMALALRFDLHQHYHKQIKLEPVHLTSEVVTAASAESMATTTATTTTTQHRRIKALYIPPDGQWGNRFWTTPAGRLLPVPDAREPLAATAFPKPYFYASLAGYAAGMLATLAVMLASNHGQPALLYLVPSVVGALWGTALGRGELREMWGYTEDGSLDTEDVVVEVEMEVGAGAGAGGKGGRWTRVVRAAGGGRANGRAAGEGARPVEVVDEKAEAESSLARVSGEDAVAKEGQKKEGGSGRYELFVFSITAPLASS